MPFPEPRQLWRKAAVVRAGRLGIWDLSFSGVAHRAGGWQFGASFRSNSWAFYHEHLDWCVALDIGRFNACVRIHRFPRRVKRERPETA